MSLPRSPPPGRVAVLVRLAEVQRAVDDDDLVAGLGGEHRQELPVGCVPLHDRLVDDAARAGLALLQPVAAGDLAGDVAVRHVEVGLGDRAALEAVGRCRSRARSSASRSRPSSASTAVISPSKIVVPPVAASETTAIFNALPISNPPAPSTVRSWSRNTSSNVSGRLTSSSTWRLEQRAGDAVGQRRAADLDLEDVGRACWAGVVDRQARARGVGRRGGDAAARRRCRRLNGSSISLTMAIARHSVGVAVLARWRSTPASRRGTTWCDVGCCAARPTSGSARRAGGSNSCSDTLHVARTGSPVGRNSVIVDVDRLDDADERLRACPTRTRRSAGTACSAIIDFVVGRTVESSLSIVRGDVAVVVVGGVEEHLDVERAQLGAR